jgi:hypothetical protein
MNEIWVIISKSGIVRTRYGWFETEEECNDKCIELRQLRGVGSDEEHYRVQCLSKYGE